MYNIYAILDFKLIRVMVISKVFPPLWSKFNNTTFRNVKYLNRDLTLHRVRIIILAICPAYTLSTIKVPVTIPNKQSF